MDDLEQQQQRRFEAFMERLEERPLPTHPLARVRALARELAEGAVEGVWEVYVWTFRGEINDPRITGYLERRWPQGTPDIALLMSNQYLERLKPDSDTLFMTRQAFELLEEVVPARIFISYKRSESSAFALLVLARLKSAGLEAFVDLSLVPGEDWQAGLRDRIKEYQFLIALLGPETLKSEVCLQELQWAMEGGLGIIPIWHNGFKYDSHDWPGINPGINRLLSSTHTIRVVEESALGYNNAIVELLNRFGVTP